METIDIINKIIKIIFINNLSFFVWKKMINYKDNNYFNIFIHLPYHINNANSNNL